MQENIKREEIEENHVYGPMDKASRELLHSKDCSEIRLIKEEDDNCLHYRAILNGERFCFRISQSLNDMRKIEIPKIINGFRPMINMNLLENLPDFKDKVLLEKGFDECDSNEKFLKAD